MEQSFECPNCQAALEYDHNSSSLTVRCPYCNSTVIVPDSLRRGQGNTAVFGEGEQQAALLAQVVTLVHSGKKIEAIKQFREAFNVRLAEAKAVVDAIERHEDIHLGGTSFHTEAIDLSAYALSPEQQRKGKLGCWLFILFFVGIIIFVAYGFITTTSESGVASEIIREVQALIDGGSETDSSDIGTAIDNIVKNDFANVVLQIGGEEGVGPGFFNDTRHIAVDGEGNIYTGDYDGGRIQVFDASGAFISTWNAGEELYMRGMTVDRDGTIYVIDTDTVERYRGIDGESLGALALPNSEDIRYEAVTNSSDGSLYFISEQRLVQLNRNGEVALDVPEPFANVPDYSSNIVSGAAVDGAGNIFVIGRDVVYKLNPQGQFVDQFGSSGDGEDQFTGFLTAIAVDGQGRVMVQSFRGIQVFDGNGRYLTTFDSPGIAFGMLVNDENDLFVMDRNGNEVRKYEFAE